MSKDKCFKCVKNDETVPEPGADKTVPAQSLWRYYQNSERIKNLALDSWAEVFFYVVFFAILLILLVRLFSSDALPWLNFPDTPPWFEFPEIPPCRGLDCYRFSYLFLMLSILFMTILMFYMINNARLCRKWIEEMAKNKLTWHLDLLKQEARGRCVDRDDLSPCLGIDLIAQRTAVIGNLFYYPFFILLLMVFSHLTYFDNWDFQAWLFFLFIFYGWLVLSAVLGLRSSAAKAKETAIQHLKDNLPDCKTSDSMARRHQIERVIDGIEHNHEGAFMPWSKYPVFRAIAMPSGVYFLNALFQLTEYLAFHF